MPHKGMRIVTTLVTTNWDSLSVPEQSKHETGRAHHSLRADLPVALDVPEPERACGGRDGLGEPDVRVLEEREVELVVLADRDECAGGIQALGRDVSGEVECGCETE